MTMTATNSFKISKKDCENILKISSSFEFTPRYTGNHIFESYTGKESIFSSLLDDDMSKEFRKYILNSIPRRFKYDVDEIQIQKYNDGGGISIHKDSYPLYIDLCVLKSNPKNGIYIYDSKKSFWNFVPDVVGNIVRIKPYEYHCIPKVYDERYSLVFIRRFDFGIL